MSDQNYSTGNPLDSFLEETGGSGGTDFGNLFVQTTEPELVPQAPPPQEVLQPQPQQSQPLQQPEHPKSPQNEEQPQPPAQNVSTMSEPLSVVQENKNGQLTMDPFEEGLRKAQEKRDERVAASFAERNPVFSYGKASDEITDSEITFDKLREQYETDFPELSEKKKVSWSVVYGKTTKNISNPESDKIFEIKAEIEASKQFLDGVKKAKKDEEREPKCLVKPRVTAQSKGEVRIPGYKGYAASVESAMQLDKPIVILPSKSGQIFEMRKTNVGTFTAPADFLPEFPALQSGFTMNYSKIPMTLLYSIISFFRNIPDLEALAHILYNTKSCGYEVRVPKQSISHVTVDAVIEEDYPEHMEHVMDIHSHNTMPAKFSPRDDKDEKATRLYAVVGRLDQVFPEISVRASCGGKFIPLKLTDVFNPAVNGHYYPDEWHNQIRHIEERKPPFPPKKTSLLKALKSLPLLKGGGNDEV